MTTLADLRRATDLMPANLRAAARKVLMYEEMAEYRNTDTFTRTARDAALHVWQELVGVIDPAEALAIAREIVGEETP